jgi:hypothetical protein
LIAGIGLHSIAGRLSILRSARHHLGSISDNQPFTKAECSSSETGLSSNEWLHLEWTFDDVWNIVRPTLPKVARQKIV